MAIGTTAAIIGAAAIGGGASLLAANKAAGASQNASDASIELQREQYGQTRADQQPYVQAGYGAVGALNSRLGLSAPAGAPTGNALAPNGVREPGGFAGTSPMETAPAQSGGGQPDFAAYGAANPDLQAEYQRLVASGDATVRGFDNPSKYYAWHYQNYGQNEGRQLPTVGAPPPAPAAPPAATATGPSVSEPGTYGNALNPTYTTPAPYQAPAYNAPSAYTAPTDFSFSVDSFKDNPAYQFAQEQGRGQVLASSAATGALQSGAALKELQDRGQKTAYNFYAPERDFAFNQYTDSRDFGRDTYEDDRNFGRGVFEGDRNFGRASYDTDRAYDRGAYQDDRDYLTNRYDTQTGNLFNISNTGQNAAALVGNAGANSTAGIVNALGSNAANQGNAAIAGANSMNALLGAGLNAYTYQKGRAY